MATLFGTERGFIDLLHHLIALDYDAIEAYDTAIEQLSDGLCREKFRIFREDHQRHTFELGQILMELGELPPDGPDMREILTTGKVVLASLVGDGGILRAMKSNEDDTNRAYERAFAHRSVPASVGPLLERALSDERRHRSWIGEQLDLLEHRGAETSA